MKKSSLGKGLYIAVALLGATSAYGISDLAVTPRPVRDEFFAVARELAETRGELNQLYRLRNFTENSRALERVGNLDSILARENSLEERREEIRISPEFKAEGRKHTSKSIAYSFAFVGLAFSLTGLGVYRDLNKLSKK